MVFIWGHDSKVDFLGYVPATCIACKSPGFMRVWQARKRFTVYFIPTFSYGQQQIIECPTCGVRYDVPKDRKPEIAGALMTQSQVSMAIQQANEQVTDLPDPGQPALEDGSGQLTS